MGLYRDYVGSLWLDIRSLTMAHTCQGFIKVLVSVTTSSWGNDMSVYVVASNLHNGPYPGPDRLHTGFAS